MNKITFRSLVAVFALLVSVVLAPRASADTIVQWTLSSGVTFTDGGTASGSFLFDAAANTFSSVNITTTGGTSFPGATYTGVLAGFASAVNVSFVPNPSLADFTNSPILNFILSPQLTDSGGTDNLFGFVGEGNCSDSVCSAIIVQRSSTAGEITGTVVSTTVPEPSALLLLGSGLVSLVWARRKGLRA